jgi:quercetin dioxygenase-like cupin family protein
MLCRLFCVAVVVCLAANAAVAQDPTKVEPKHYKLNFENERVQVVHVYYGPHEKSEMHEHPAGVSVALSDGHLRFTDQNGKVTEVYAKRGEARWFPAHKHEVENLGDEPYNAVYVGMKGKVTQAAGDRKPNSPVSAEELTNILAKILADPAQATAKR